MKNQTCNVRLAIKRVDDIIADFQPHSNGKLNLWASITDLSEKYNITIVLYNSPFPNFKYDDFVEVLMALQQDLDLDEFH